MKQYIAVMFEVCPHEDLYIDMNEYVLDTTAEMEQQVSSLAQKDIANVVHVYESDADNEGNRKLYKKYHFKEFDCGCESQG